MSDENSERFVNLRGPKGEQGDEGAPGPPGMTPGARRGFVYLSLLMLLLSAANLLYTARQTGAADSRSRAQCGFDTDLGSAPVALSLTGKASQLAVTIVSDARIAWHQAGCDGHLPGPSPSFRHWAVYYHLPVG
jgi:hypothetical protein